ncbi:MAG TPA: Type 1 glutamine amidotransferase-like domain-containing protein, partial [bacterium]|nr:Type 1 glutamine amidotransferase-like domain-containing protein [bacterium]
MRLLLCSNSTNFGENYLDHWAAEIVDFLGAIKQIVFVPYALDDLNAYTKKTRDRYAEMGIRVAGIHENDPRKMVT